MANETNGKTIMVQGRIVWINGNLFTGNLKTEYGSKTPVFDAQGAQIREYAFGLAVPKTHAQEIWQAIHDEAFTLHPSRQIPPGFAMKYKDGDTAIDEKGAPYSQREGYAGCLVFSCSTRIPIKFFRWENGANTMINDGIKCGDYVQAQLSIKAHTAIGKGKAGLYVNPMAVQFLGYGPEIVNTPSGDQIFGLQAPALPPGATAMPMAPQGMGLLVPPTAPLQMQSYPQPMGTSAGPLPGPAPMPPQQQHYGVLPPQFQPTPQAAPPQPAAYPQPGSPAGYSQPPMYPQQTQQSAYAPPQMPGFPAYPQR